MTDKEVTEMESSILIELCKEKLPEIEAKNEWTIKDYFIAYHGHFEMVEGEYQIHKTSIEKIAFDPRTPKDIAEGMQETLKSWRD